MKLEKQDNNKQRVFIRILGNVNLTQGSAESDIIEFFTEGDIENVDNCIYLTYEESKVSGMEGTTTTLRIDDQQVSLIRMGTVNYAMDFQKGGKIYNQYETNYGELSMGVVTNDVVVEYDKQLPKRIYVDYDLDINGMMVGNNIVSIHVNQN